MFVSLSVVKYSKPMAFMGFLSMAVFRLPLMLNSKITFWKLMGCGKNGTFDINPDWQQWALMIVWKDQKAFEEFSSNSFISKWWQKFSETQTTHRCIPYESHGKWDGKTPFGSPEPDRSYNGQIAVLTRATIRFSKLRDFWRNVPKVAESMSHAEGFITSVGIGEVPFVKQATFSIWKDLESVKKFAYRQRDHAEVVKKTRTNQWYSEELFARFVPILDQKHT